MVWFLKISLYIWLHDVASPVQEIKAYTRNALVSSDYLETNKTYDRKHTGFPLYNQMDAANAVVV